MYIFLYVFENICIKMLDICVKMYIRMLIYTYTYMSNISYKWSHVCSSFRWSIFSYVHRYLCRFVFAYVCLNMLIYIYVYPAEEKYPMGNKSDRTLEITNLKNEMILSVRPDLLPIGHFSSAVYVKYWLPVKSCFLII
jgi:hypothetical protein